MYKAGASGPCLEKNAARVTRMNCWPGYGQRPCVLITLHGLITLQSTVAFPATGSGTHIKAPLGITVHGKQKGFIFQVY